MVGVHFGCVAAHGFGKAENVLAPGVQKVEPQPVGRHKFCVLPRIAANIILPAMAHRVVGVHYIAVVKQAVPMPCFHLTLIERERPVKD